MPRQAELIHLYEFESGLGDTLGGTGITANGGAVGSGEYSFAPNQGLTLDTGGVELASHYSIGLRFTVASSVAGWKKIIDFKDRLDARGVYAFDETIGFINIGGSANPVLFPDTEIELVGTRDAQTGLFNCYVNGSSIPEFTVADPTKLSVALFNGSTARFRFFMDDTVPTEFTSAYSGTVDEIRVWDGPLSADDIQNAFQAVAAPIRITDISVDMGAGNDIDVTLSWNSQPGQTYSVDFSSDLKNWQERRNDVAASGGSETTYEETLQAAPNSGRGYYRVRQN